MSTLFRGILWTLSIFLYLSRRLTEAQIFQYFIVNNHDATAKVIDTVKLPTCAHLDLRKNVTLRGGISSGKFTKHGIVKDMKTCIDVCCQDEACDVAFMPGLVCYTIDCFSEELCESIPATPSQAANGSVQISHIVRGGGKGDDLDEFRRNYGINKNPNKKQDVCVPSRVAYNYTLRGGRYAGEMMEIGDFKDIHDCVDKCCLHASCEVAYLLNGKCFSVDCYTKDLCQSMSVKEKHKKMDATIVYMNKRNGQRQKDKDTCTRPCVHGLCTRNDTCMCDIGYKGPTCNETQKKGHCDPPCGVNGFCMYNDTCRCDEGWTGYKCDRRVECKRPCEHGICIDNKTNLCKCNFGWEGKLCNVSNGDKVVMASSGEEVLFTDMDAEPDFDIKIHEMPSVKETESISALAVAIGCGVAAAVVGTAAVVFIARQVFGKRTVTNYELLRAPLQHDRRR